MRTITVLTISLIFTIPTILTAQTMEKKKPNVISTVDIFIDATPDKVWEILAEDFAGIGKWSSGVSHSEGFGNPIGDSPHSIRACEITAAGFDDTKEEILEFDEQNYTLRYSLFDGLPGFVKDAENTWRLTAQGAGTQVSAKTVMRATGPMGFMMRGIMKGATQKALSSMAEEVKYYIEQGKPHPNKVASKEKLGRKDSKLRKKVTSFEVVHEIAAPLEDVWKTIGEDFGEVYKSHPVSPYSEYLEGFHTPEIGAKRIMFMSDNRKKYFVDKLVKWEPQKHLTIEISEKKGYPIRPAYTWLNMDLEKIDTNRTQLKMRFNYLTKPNFLKGLIKGRLKKNFKEYAWAIDHYAKTGGPVTRENWGKISLNYR